MMAVAADFLQRVGNAIGLPRELHCRGVRKILALPRDRSFYQAGEEYADPAQDGQPKADSAGLVLGARVPVILTSRADSAEARLASCAVAVAFAYWLRGGSGRGDAHA